jgi:hypothetical protein
MKKRFIRNDWFVPIFSAAITVLYLLMFFFPIHGDKLIPLGQMEKSVWGIQIVTLETPPDLYFISLLVSVFGLMFGALFFGRLIKQCIKDDTADKLCLVCLLSSMVVIPTMLNFFSTIFQEPLGILACFISTLIIGQVVSSLITLIFIFSKKLEPDPEPEPEPEPDSEDY